MEFSQFCYWLQGFAEINGMRPSDAEWQVIKEHLDTCFNKVTPIKKDFSWPYTPNKSIWADEPIRIIC